ncbi:MAG: hypothetical protein IJW24_01015 [Clostridia bacterium]|nr:hypothetical protein [Clostridia bacterium]
MLFKILGVGIVTVILSSILKNSRSDFSLLINICGGLIIFYILIDGITELFDGIGFLSENANISSSIISSIVKVIGVGYVTEFCADIAEDSGNKFVANKVILGGKIALCVMAFPIIRYLFQTIISLI